MSSKKQNQVMDPVILVMLGIVLISIAIGLAVFQSKNADAARNSGTTGQLIVAFITGLTTGGLSCLAVQGGLLASSLAKQIEHDYAQHAVYRKTHKRVKAQMPVRSSSAFSIFLFLVAKV